MPEADDKSFQKLGGEEGRAADSLAIRAFLQIALDEATPDQSTISRTRRLIDVETYQLVFVWVLDVLAERGLLRGKTIGIDATTLEANAVLRSIAYDATVVSTMSSFCAG